MPREARRLLDLVRHDLELLHPARPVPRDVQRVEGAAAGSPAGQLLLQGRPPSSVPRPGPGAGEAVSIGTGSGSTFLIPSLSKRSANATVELMDGQTIGIAGLLNENLREVIHKFPGLGNLPILGHLFRSQDFVKGETELVILVTPHLAKPIAPDKIKLPTDNFVEPTDSEFYLLGRMEGAGDRESSATTGGGTKADFGHDLD